MADKCGTCGKPENFPEDSKSELRPYGSGGAFICYRCAFETPESAEAVKANFYAISNAEQAATGVHVIKAREDGAS